MPSSETLSFTLVGRDAGASSAFRGVGNTAELAARGARTCAMALEQQRKAADASVGATLALAKADKILAEAEKELSGEASKADREIRRLSAAGGSGGRGPNVPGGSPGGGGRPGFFDRGIIGGAGPGLGFGLTAKRASLLGLAGVGLGGLPALAAIGATGALGGLGISTIFAGAHQLIGTKTNPGELFAPFQKAMKSFQSAFASAATGLAKPLRQVFAEIPQIMKNLTPALHALFAGAGALIQPLVTGLSGLAKTVLPLLGQAFRAIGPLIGTALRGFTRLAGGLLPGLITLLKAAQPAFGALASVLGTVGKNLGDMFRSFAPVIRQSALIFRSLGDVIAAIFPVIGKLAAIFARALAPIFADLAKVIKSLEPVLVIIGGVIADLAKAVLTDLASAFGAVAGLIHDISPALNILAKAFKGVFDVLENSGVFAIIGDAIESVVPLLARLVNTLVKGLAPILPPVIKLIGALAGDAIQLLVGAIQTILPPLISFVNIVLKALQPILPPIEKAIQELAGALTKFLLAGFKAMLPAIRGMIGPLTELLKSIVPILPPVIRLTAKLIELALLAIKPLLPWLTKAADGMNKPVEMMIKVIAWVARVISSFVNWASHLSSFSRLWDRIWGDIKDTGQAAVNWIGQHIVSPVVNFFTRTIPNAFGTGVKAIGRAWDAIKNTVRVPVNWVITHVVDGLIGAFDWISSKVGGPHIAKIPGLAKGGRIPGFGGGDRYPALLEGGEAVVDKRRTAMLAPLFGAMGVPGFADGGLVGGRQRATSKTGHPSGFLGGLFDIGRIMAAIFSGNSTALVNAITSLVGGGSGGATGALSGLLTAIPRALISAVAKFFISHAGIANSGNIIRYAESFIGKVPYVWGGTTPAGWDCSGFTDWVYNHFGIHMPRTAAQQYYWSRRVGHPVPGGLAFFTGADGTVTNPGHVGIVIDPRRYVSAYGTGFGTLIEPIWGSSGTVIGFGVPPGGSAGRTGVGSRFDRGGTLRPGLNMVYNGTGAPERLIRPGGPPVLEVRGGGSEFERFMAGFIKKYVRVAGGGDVQVAFGTSY